jgi:hypothetical protein
MRQPEGRPLAHAARLFRVLHANSSFALASRSLQLIDAGRDGAGEPSVDGVRHVVMDAVGQLQAGQRLVGMELAIAQLGHWSSH